MTIRLAESATEVERCCPVLGELRPQLSGEELLERVRRRRADGYALAYVEDNGEVKAVAGYRVAESLGLGLI